MSVYDLIQKRRTIRKFKQQPIDKKILEQMMDAARLAPSASNLQPLEYVLVTRKETVNSLFEFTQWARYLQDGSGRPSPDQMPTAFIVVLANKKHKTAWTCHDVGAAVENMILTGLESGIGACWIASLNRVPVRELLSVPEEYEIDSVVAFGYPDESPVMEPLKDSLEYYKDNNGVLHVPKRDLSSMLHFDKF